jgi:hypothetical protein
MWVPQAEIDRGMQPGTSTNDARRIAELERENREISQPAQEMAGPARLSSCLIIFEMIGTR